MFIVYLVKKIVRGRIILIRKAILVTKRKII